MVQFILVLPLLVGFFITLFFLPAWIRRAHKVGLVGKDMNKYSKPEVAEAGGVAVIAGFLGGLLIYIAIKTFQFNASEHLVEIFALLSVVLIASLVGIVDGILGWKKGLSRKVRIFIMIFSAVPLMVINAGHDTVSIFGNAPLNLGIIYPLLIIPIGIVGASTTFNFLAGFNGLEARQGILILLALAIATWFTGTTWLTMISLIMVAALVAFLFFNNFPAQVFPGDVLTYAIGVLIPAIAILGNLEKFAVFIFIPNIIEVILKLRGRLNKESFAIPNKDDSLELPSDGIYGWGHLAIRVLKKFKNKVSEKDIVFFINLSQIIVIIIAFIIFKKGIFG